MFWIVSRTDNYQCKFLDSTFKILYLDSVLQLKELFIKEEIPNSFVFTCVRALSYILHASLLGVDISKPNEPQSCNLKI